MTLELRQLRYFIAVAEERHFGRAAARLRIAQPGLSQQIKRLETTAGVSLLDRDKRQVHVTPAGEAFLYYARLAVAAADRAVENARAAEAKTGLLKIGSWGLTMFAGMREAMKKFATRFPQVQVDLHPGITKHVIAGLVRREIDLAAVFEPFESAEHVHYQTVGWVEPLVICAASHRFAELDAIPNAALLEETVFMWPRTLNPPLVDHIRALLFGASDPRAVIESADVAETFMRVAEGDGIALVSPSLVELKPERIAARALEDPPRFNFGAAWLDPPVSPFVGPFVDIWRDAIGAGADG